MKLIGIAIALLLLSASQSFAQCEGGICAARIAPVARIVQRERIMVRAEASSNARRPIVANAAGRVLDVASRPFRRVWFRRNDRG